ncbi:MAG: alkaline phosphatase family protein [Acidobacteriota bacterium]|nr:alkaline phosphatase family protein [Acidobacteriota bacterium]
MAVQGSPPQDIDQLRERLRALGYLDARVDRYVLGSAASGAGRARFAIAAGLRVGLVAGAMLGVSAAIALAARAPGFISSRRDAVILALALSLVFAVVSAAAVSATVLAASWYANRSARLTSRRAHLVATSAGIFVALGSAAYLALWWTAARDVLTSLTFGWNVAALAIAAGIALLLAHAVSVVILAALARAADAGDITAGGLLSSRAFLAAFGVLLFAGSAALVATGGDPRAATAAAPITVAPTGVALRVIAIDGFDTDVSARLMDGGGLPSLSRLLRGARIPLESEPGTTPDPARDWTTIATGQSAARHGIASLEGRRAVGIDGRLPQARGAAVETLLNAADLLRLTTPSIASGAERRDPAFWEVASAAGLRTAVVNWWATWPAPAGDDVVITDRALLRLDTGGTLDAEIAPAVLYGSLAKRWPEMRRKATDTAASRFAGIADAELRRVMMRSAELDLLVAELATSLDGPPLDLLVVYLPGLDIAQFNLLQSGTTSSVSALGERVAALEGYYRFLDDIVGRLVAPSAAHVDAAILWPGRVARREGALTIAGAAVKPGVCTTCDDVGAAATLLYLLGLPIAEDLGSAVALSVIGSDFARAHDVRRVPDYRGVTRDRSPRTGQPLDAEALERLRSLGYIR